MTKRTDKLHRYLTAAMMESMAISGEENLAGVAESDKTPFIADHILKLMNEIDPKRTEPINDQITLLYTRDQMKADGTL